MVFTSDENKKYQCSQTCPECNLCHLIWIEYNIYLKINAQMRKATDRELCNFFREKVKYVKEKCVFPYDIKNGIK